MPREWISINGEAAVSAVCVKNILLWGFPFKILFFLSPLVSRGRGCCYCGWTIVCMFHRCSRPATLKVIFSIHLLPLGDRFLYLFCGFSVAEIFKISFPLKPACLFANYVVFNNDPPSKRNRLSWNSSIIEGNGGKTLVLISTNNFSDWDHHEK